MDIDFCHKASAESVGQSASVLLQPRRPRGGGLERTSEASGLEATATTESAGTPKSEREWLQRLAEALATAHPAAVPEREQEGLKQQVLDGARSGLAKVYESESLHNFTLGQHIGLEALILTNGERPSLFVREGFVDLKASDIGGWELNLEHFQNQVRAVITSVGRIQIPVKPWIIGTCFVIAEGLVLTNRHVLEAIATQDAGGGWTLNSPDATTVDFVGEDGAAAVTKFKITGVAFAGPNPINRTVNFAHLDMAILRIDPASDPGSAFPNPVTFETDTAQPSANRDLYVVGFPGRPVRWDFAGPLPPGAETTRVISTIFNDKFGVKRLAPGIIKAGPGEIADDGQGWICAHDASTLGGNSGSCVADLTSDGFRIVALHFAGTSRAQNWAHVAARLREQLAAFSATFVA